MKGLFTKVLAGLRGATGAVQVAQACLGKLVLYGHSRMAGAGPL